MTPKILPNPNQTYRVNFTMEVEKLEQLSGHKVLAGRVTTSDGKRFYVCFVPIEFAELEQNVNSGPKVA